MIETVTAGLDTIDHVPATQWFEKELESLAVQSQGAVRKVAADVLRNALDADAGLDDKIGICARRFGSGLPRFELGMLDGVVAATKRDLDRLADQFGASELDEFPVQRDLAYEAWIENRTRRATADVANREFEPDWAGARLHQLDALERLIKRVAQSELPAVIGFVRSEFGSQLSDHEIEDICVATIDKVLRVSKPIEKSYRSYFKQSVRNAVIDYLERRGRVEAAAEKAWVPALTSGSHRPRAGGAPQDLFFADEDGLMDAAVIEYLHNALWRAIAITFCTAKPAPHWWSPDLRARSTDNEQDRELRNRHARNVGSAARAVLTSLAYSIDVNGEVQPEKLAREAVRDQFSPTPSDKTVQRSYPDVVYGVWQGLVAVDKDLARAGVPQLTNQWRIAQLRPVAKELKNGFPGKAKDKDLYPSGDAPKRMEARARWICAVVEDLMDLPYMWASVVHSAVDAALNELIRADRAEQTVVERANAAYDDEHATGDVHRKADAVIKAYNKLHGVAEDLGGR